MCVCWLWLICFYILHTGSGVTAGKQATVTPNLDTAHSRLHLPRHSLASSGWRRDHLKDDLSLYYFIRSWSSLEPVTLSQQQQTQSPPHPGPWWRWVQVLVQHEGKGGMRPVPKTALRCPGPCVSCCLANFHICTSTSTSTSSLFLKPALAVCHSLLLQRGTRRQYTAPGSHQPSPANLPDCM